MALRVCSSTAGEVTLENDAKAYELRELDIFEVSLVQIPANQHAEVTDVKGAKAGRRNSKSDEDTIRQAIGLLQSLLGEEQDEGDDQADGSKGGEGDETPEGREDDRKSELIALLKSIEAEED